MLRRVLELARLRQPRHEHHEHGTRHHGAAWAHPRRGRPSIATTERGIWAIKWSFVILARHGRPAAGGACSLSGSVALLADTIHNVGDAATAIPLVDRLLPRRGASRATRFTYG